MSIISRAMIFGVSAIVLPIVASSPDRAFALAPPVSSSAARVVALSDSPAPGGSAVFDAFVPGVLNRQSHTAFQAYLKQGIGGINANNDLGIWSEGSGALQRVASEGGPAPNTPAGTAFDLFGEPLLDVSGRVAFRASLRGSAAGVTVSNDTGIWSERSGSLSLVAREGSQAPGTPAGARFGNLNAFGDLRLNSGGHVAFRADLVQGAGGVTTANDTGIWAEQLGSLQLVVRAGDPAPGAPSGALFSDINDPGFNDLGQVAFRGHLQIGPGGVDVFNQDGIWSGGGGALHVVALRNDQAPGAPAGARFGGFFLPALNNNGQSAFSAVLMGSAGGVTSANDIGVWSEGSGSLQLVARKGGQAPNTPAGAIFNEFFSPLIDDAGQTAFYARLQTGAGGVTANNAMGIWSDAGGSLHLVARQGAPAPGTPSGTTFSDFFNSPVLNSAGQLAFLASLSGASGNGIWAVDRAGQLQLIARAGDVLDVDDGSGVDLRTISGLYFQGGSGGGDGSRSCFNEHGQLTFAAEFTDGSDGIVVSNIVAVPEPASWLMIGLAMSLLACRNMAVRS